MALKVALVSPTQQVWSQEFQVRGGFLSVSNDRVSILTESVA